MSRCEGVDVQVMFCRCRAVVSRAGKRECEEKVVWCKSVSGAIVEGES